MEAQTVRVQSITTSPPHLELIRVLSTWSRTPLSRIKDITFHNQLTAAWSYLEVSKLRAPSDSNLWLLFRQYEKYRKTLCLLRSNHPDTSHTSLKKTWCRKTSWNSPIRTLISRSRFKTIRDCQGQIKATWISWEERSKMHLGGKQKKLRSFSIMKNRNRKIETRWKWMNQSIPFTRCLSNDRLDCGTIWRASGRSLTLHTTTEVAVSCRSRMNTALPIDSHHRWKKKRMMVQFAARARHNCQILRLRNWPNVLWQCSTAYQADAIISENTPRELKSSKTISTLSMIPRRNVSCLSQTIGKRDLSTRKSLRRRIEPRNLQRSISHRYRFASQQKSLWATSGLKSMKLAQSNLPSRVKSILQQRQKNTTYAIVEWLVYPDNTEVNPSSKWTQNKLMNNLEWLKFRTHLCQ